MSENNVIKISEKFFGYIITCVCIYGFAGVIGGIIYMMIAMSTWEYVLASLLIASALIAVIALFIIERRRTKILMKDREEFSAQYPGASSDAMEIISNVKNLEEREETIRNLLAILRSNTDTQTRCKAAINLGNIRAFEAIPDLKVIILDEVDDFMIHNAVIEGIGKIDTKSAVDVLGDLLLDCSHPGVRESCSLILGTMLEKRNLSGPFLQIALQTDSSIEVREMAFFSLGLIGYIEALSVMEHALATGSVRVNIKTRQTIQRMRQFQTIVDAAKK